MALTEKMKAFCREYLENGGNGTQAYLKCYNSSSEQAAAIESCSLLKREDINEYITSLRKPIEQHTQNLVISEREKKRNILWSFINDSNKSDSDRLKALDLLNKMDAEYVNITKQIDDAPAPIVELPTQALQALTSAV